MFSFRRSLTALVGLFVLVGMLAALTPLVGRGQGNSQSAPPPFSVRDEDNPARHPFQASVTVNSTASDGSAQIAVPAGTRLVIEHVSAESKSLISNEILRFDVKTSVGGTLVTHYFISAAQGDNGFPVHVAIHRVSQPVRLYADPPSVEVQLDVPGIGPPTPGPVPATGTVTLSGYLVAVP
jgi:hypothetical protein